MVADIAGPAAEALDLHALGGDEFVGRCHRGAVDRVYGGQLAAQALMAAASTTDCAPHSLHGYFLAAGAPQRDIRYRVERTRDGTTYANRRVVAEQAGCALFTLAASFKHRENGPHDRAAQMPSLPGPEDLPDPLAAWARRDPQAHAASGWTDACALRWVPVPMGSTWPGRTTQATWIRMRGTLPDAPSVHASALTYLSDITLAWAAAQGIAEHVTVRRGPHRARLASIDHAMWFHRPFRADEWLLFVQHSVTVGDGRGLSSGELWSRDGRLVASAAQESVVRDRPDRASQESRATPTSAVPKGPTR